MYKISIVICLYNEELNISPLIDGIEKALSGLSFETIMINDGSTDHTEKEIRRNARPWLRLINFRKNYGQSAALAAGIHYASGEYIVTMDGDLQNDPSDIPMMLEKIELGDDEIIAGFRENRKDNFLLRKLPSLLANSLIRKTTRVKIKDYGCTLKIFKSSIAKDLALYGELHRFIPVLASLDGVTNIGQVGVKHHKRIHGKSKYGLGRFIKVTSDLLLLLFLRRYMVRPMHLFGGIGIIITAIGGAINLYLLGLKIAGHDIWGKPLLMLGILLLITGFQFITIGLITEVLMRTYFESQGKKPYNIKSIVSFEPNTKMAQDFSKTRI
jgi:glycosyltransferase involved in cell wall biosynthesis